MKNYMIRNIQNETYKQIRIIAAHKETSINEVVKMAIERFVKIEQSKNTGWKKI